MNKTTVSRNEFCLRIMKRIGKFAIEQRYSKEEYVQLLKEMSWMYLENAKFLESQIGKEDE